MKREDEKGRKKRRGKGRRIGEEKGEEIGEEETGGGNRTVEMVGNESLLAIFKRIDVRLTKSESGFGMLNSEAHVK